MSVAFPKLSRWDWLVGWMDVSQWFEAHPWTPRCKKICWVPVGNTWYSLQSYRQCRNLSVLQKVFLRWSWCQRVIETAAISSMKAYVFLSHHALHEANAIEVDLNDSVWSWERRWLFIEEKVDHESVVVAGGFLSLNALNAFLLDICDLPNKSGPRFLVMKVLFGLLCC